MKKHYILGILYWVAMVLIGGFLVMGGWNLVIVKLFNLTPITYTTSLIVSLILSFFSRRSFRRCVH